MGIKQNHTILGNELTRRLYSIDGEMKEAETEIEEVIENFTKQAKNSGWGQKETREMVISGYLEWRRRLVRRIEQGGMAYRSAESSLALRTETKLMGKETWCKGSKKNNTTDGDIAQLENIQPSYRVFRNDCL